jgi:hypothetical protein
VEYYSDGGGQKLLTLGELTSKKSLNYWVWKLSAFRCSLWKWYRGEDMEYIWIGGG